MSFVSFSGHTGKVQGEINRWLVMNDESATLKLVVHHMNTVSTDVGTILVSLMFSYVPLKDDHV